VNSGATLVRLEEPYLPARALCTLSLSWWALRCCVRVRRLSCSFTALLFPLRHCCGIAGSVRLHGGRRPAGVFGGVGIGLAMYYGLLQVSMKHLFAVTTWLIILLAAGMASQGAAFLVQADLLPPLEDAVWDTSWVLTDSSILGKTLHTLVGYSAQPSGTQLIFYAATLTVIGLLTWLYRSSTQAVPAVRQEGLKRSLSRRRA
jgi:hypothetical protein